MSSNKKTTANRRNASHSTGPRTAQGKAASSMNALRHGLRANSAVLPGEDHAEFNSLHDGLQQEFQPQTPSEQHLVDGAAAVQWKLRRLERIEAAAYCGSQLPDAQFAVFRAIIPLQCSLERAFLKFRKELEQIRLARIGPSKSADPSTRTSPSAHPAPPVDPSGKPDKDAWRKAPKFELTLVDPSTGFTDVLFRSEYGKPVKYFSDEIPADPNAPGAPQPPVAHR